MAFKYAIYKINNADDILPNNTLVYDIQYVPAEDSFRTTKKVRKNKSSNQHLNLWLLGSIRFLAGGT